jgi:hypothetical protein
LGDCVGTSAGRRSRKSACRSPRTGMRAFNEPAFFWRRQQRVDRTIGSRALSSAMRM